MLELENFCADRPYAGGTKTEAGKIQTAAAVRDRAQARHDGLTGALCSTMLGWNVQVC